MGVPVQRAPAVAAGGGPSRCAGGPGAGGCGGGSTDAAIATRTRPQPAPVVRAVLGAGVSVEMADLTPAALATLKHAASMSNPAFYDRQRRRFSTWGIPRFLHSYDETLDGKLVLPRGLANVVASVVEEAGSKLELADERVSGQSQQFGFTAALRDDQAASVAELTDHDLGVLVAPAGAGAEAVIACAVIARHATSTLVLVDRKTLADQWLARLQEHIGVTAGQIGGTEEDARHGGRGDAPDPCAPRRPGRADHHVRARGRRRVPSSRPRRSERGAPDRCEALLGLTATPYRRDQLDDDRVAARPVRHTMSVPAPGTLAAAAAGIPERSLTVHLTAFEYRGVADPSAPGGIAAIYRDLVADKRRNEQLVGDVAAALDRGRHCLSADEAFGDGVGPRRPHRGLMTRTSMAMKTASNAAVNLASRSRMRNRKRRPASSRSMSRLRACWVSQAPVGWAVTRGCARGGWRAR